MDQECKIVDEEEMSNFRRFKPEDLEKKYSPFERVQKKEFPFLFQKKHIPKETMKTSLEDIINKMKDLSCNSPAFHSIEYPNLLPFTPPFLSQEIICQSPLIQRCIRKIYSL